MQGPSGANPQTATLNHRFRPSVCCMPQTATLNHRYQCLLVCFGSWHGSCRGDCTRHWPDASAPPEPTMGPAGRQLMLPPLLRGHDAACRGTKHRPMVRKLCQSWGVGLPDTHGHCTLRRSSPPTQPMQRFSGATPQTATLNHRYWPLVCFGSWRGSVRWWPTHDGCAGLALGWTRPSFRYDARRTSERTKNACFSKNTLPCRISSTAAAPSAVCLKPAQAFSDLWIAVSCAGPLKLRSNASNSALPVPTFLRLGCSAGASAARLTLGRGATASPWAERGGRFRACWRSSSVPSKTAHKLLVMYLDTVAHARCSLLGFLGCGRWS
mmetsp:Transcript_45591/g.120535  ORF Transcript_45591/g.120535 Transcript_45591/m.120535 type:complete len:325 (-) Transcript_45591:237-1211(-)